MHSENGEVYVPERAISFGLENRLYDDEIVVYNSAPRYHPFASIGTEHAGIAGGLIAFHAILIAVLLWRYVGGLDKEHIFGIFTVVEILIVSSMLSVFALTLRNYFILTRTEYVITNRRLLIYKAWPTPELCEYALEDVDNIELQADNINKLYGTSNLWLGVWRLRPSSRGGTTYVPGMECLCALPDGERFKEMLELARVRAIEELKRNPFANHPANVVRMPDEMPLFPPCPVCSATMDGVRSAGGQVVCPRCNASMRV